MYMNYLPLNMRVRVFYHLVYNVSSYFFGISHLLGRRPRVWPFTNGKWYGRYRPYHLHCMPNYVCASNKKLRCCSLPKTTKVTEEATTRKWDHAIYKLEDLTYRDAKAITLCISRYLSQPHKLNQTY